MKLAFAGGGTGGHLAPAIALIEELRERGSDSGAIFLTAGPPVEYLSRVVPGSRVFAIPAAAISPWRPWSALSRLLLNRQGYLRSIEILKSDPPDLLIGLGGYVSLSPVLAAWWLKIPVVVHEQNRVLGRANRFLARRSVGVISSFPLRSGRHNPARVVQLGFPIRRAAREPAPKGTAAAWGLKPGRFTVLVLGGSRGARAINRLLEEVAGCLSGSAQGSEIQIIHCAGPEDSERLTQAYRERGLTAAVFPGLQKIGWAYSLAQLAVSRAGGATLGELAAWGLPAILIPYPFATDDHQLANARYFARAGGAVVYPEPEITSSLLAEEIFRLRLDPGHLREMAAAARRLGTPEAGRRIVDYLSELRDKYART